MTGKLSVGLTLPNRDWANLQYWNKVKALCITVNMIVCTVLWLPHLYKSSLAWDATFNGVKQRSIILFKYKRSLLYCAKTWKKDNTREVCTYTENYHHNGPSCERPPRHRFFSWFPCVYKQMLRWFPRFQVATTCFSCSPPDLNLLFILISTNLMH